MAVPSSRETFKEFCLRRLGKPVIEINVDDDQVGDAIDTALNYYHDYHFDGSQRTFLKHEITADDKTNGYISISDSNTIGIIDIFDIGDATSTNNLFNIRYQIALNDLYDLSRYDLVPFYMNFMNIRFIEEILIGKQPIKFNRHINRLYVDMDWDKLNTGDFLIAEVYNKVDPDTYTDVYGDRWLAEYATALIQIQWGRNLTKFVGMQLPGGVQFNGDTILSQGLEAKNKLEEEMLSSYSLPVHDMTG
jgi:hypothetical protein|tara:strand:+ start:9151 stop:9894 length:744 start_codon:yes stop_codon:yes gene_type:complete